MRMNFNEFVEKMQSAPDLGKSGSEQDILNELIANPPEEYYTCLLWVLEDFEGYTITRAEAGEALIKGDRAEGIDALKRLADSNNFLDRDVALTLAESLDETDLKKLLLPVLTCDSPWQRLEATNLLHDLYPQQVKQALIDLIQEELKDEFKSGLSKKVKEAAAKKLQELESGY